MRLNYLAAMGALVVAAGCGGPAPGKVQGSCKTSSLKCIEIIGYAASVVQSNMQACGAAWSTKPCDRATTLGGCQFITVDGITLHWYYGMLAADAQYACKAEGGYWLATP